MTEYFLPKHVYFCGKGDAVVFLDLKNDEYSMISGEQSRAFLSLFLKTHAHSTSEDEDVSERVAEPVAGFPHALKDVLEAGLLITTAQERKPVIPTYMEPSTERLVDRELVGSVHIRALDICRFAASCTKAALQLRLRTLESTVHSVGKRRMLRTERQPCNLDEARVLVEIFTRLRSIFPTDYLCLFDSLALIEFLARYGIFPTWVFAVRLDPWEAHCWVQDGQILFNDDTEAVSDFVPIMTV